MIRRLLYSSVIAAALMDASAFVVSKTPGPGGNPRRWQLAATNPNVHTNVVNPTTRAIRYYLASDGYSPTNTQAELNALRASFDQWQLVSGTILRFEDAGLAAPGIDVSDDDSNVVFFARSSTLVNGGTSDISGLPAATFYTFLSDGTMLEADIVFNAAEYEWFADFSSTNAHGHFIEGVALHEIGDMLGLAHSPLGGATMMRLGAPGVNPRAGLSADEISAARALYPAGPSGTFGVVRGTVRKNGSPVLGAVVVLERADSGNAVAGSLTGSAGSYEMPAVDPGTYNLRVVPLDPANAPEALMRGVDISPEFTSADPSFAPTTNRIVTVTASMTNVVDFAVQNATPLFRVAYLRTPTTSSGFYQRTDYPAVLRPGQENWTIGVGSSNLPTSGATLSITGDGLTVGPSILLNVGGQRFISARVSVASNATPGLRTFVVRDGANNLAYANGFLEIAPLNADYDYDGLADTFQRQYFSRFTLPQADPGADPDGDTFLNSAEHRAGTNPTNSVSLLRIERVTHTVAGATVTWRSSAGKRYQLHQKPVLTEAAWSPVGVPVTAVGTTSQQLDPNGAAGRRFYRVEVLP